MDINTIVLVVILIVMVYALTEHLKEKNTVAESTRQKNIAEKEEISQEEIATYGQVQERKNQLLNSELKEGQEGFSFTASINVDENYFSQGNLDSLGNGFFELWKRIE